ncbi:Glycine dehydrogenase (decarboxylating), mitochondrial [Oopsacas minuta]|uniref:Glycine cleavage system P protein n=1 Tax=Oopsacas minuta TaxID=111878 RepID=A0AAV7KK41_9METZ|nr:Glycine dehydrogenase (decarboxylating), mitochondrial [Oopsacas minuta]
MLHLLPRAVQRHRTFLATNVVTIFRASTKSFVRRHIGPRESETKAMLDTCGVSSLNELIKNTIPTQILYTKPLDIAEPLTEAELLARIKEIGNMNKQFRSYIGMGYYGCHIPSPILRNVLENPAWYTPYTPYQAEISQGRMEALFNFQSMVTNLTALDVANASMLDEATAAAEAMGICVRQTKKKVFLIDELCHPQTIATVMTRANSLGIKSYIVDLYSKDTNLYTDELAGVLLQCPDTQGSVIDLTALTDKIHKQGGLVVVATDLLASTIIKPVGEMNVDVAVGSSQRFGVPMGYGGPHAGFLAAKRKLVRNLPGRLIGVSRDTEGKPVYRLTLQAREQHIKRDKATSNICTAQALLANVASFYAVYHGPQGMKDIAADVHHKTTELASTIQGAGMNIKNKYFFDTLLVECNPSERKGILTRARLRNINLRVYPGDEYLGVSLDETVSQKDLSDLKWVFTGAHNIIPDVTGIRNLHDSKLARTTPILQFPVFRDYHSETSFMRYVRKLEILDYGLCNSMIPLGSCTMKLNAATEMIPITFPEFANIHPFVPFSQAVGYQQILNELENDLINMTGYDKISFQSNSGSQGEYAGLLAIRRYLESIGETQRTVCLVPSSAHGTNPASSKLAGLETVYISSTDVGSIDLDDMKRKVDTYSDRLAVAMFTYPSTNGVFDESITDMCDIIHNSGGQVYIDGANMNAQVGLARPGDYGGDVSHFNLHKTFCIPHGGGGPGMGPIGVKKHLIPYLPTHPVIETDVDTTRSLGTVSAAPFGSSLILLITWAYIRMMGPNGLKQASLIAILNSNYMRRRLEEHFKILFHGTHGFTAHEVLLDIRSLHIKSGIDATDIAKRLQDYGFHAPTMHWPVHDNLMIEPTESENKKQLDRYCDALIQIKKEINEVVNKEYPLDDNVLKNSPHSIPRLMASEWTHPYTREKAAFPLPWVTQEKFWPNCSRVDDVHGDRNLILTHQDLIKADSQTK